MEDGEARLGNVPGPAWRGRAVAGVAGAQGGQPRCRGRMRRTARAGQAGCGSGPSEVSWCRWRGQRALQRGGGCL